MPKGGKRYGGQPMPSEEERLGRISSNLKKLPGKQRRNVLGGTRSGEIVRHANASMGGFGRPQDKVKKK